MSYDLKAVIRRLETGIDRDDLEDRYVDYVNSAIREMCNRRSFIDMRTTARLTIPAGSSEARMPDDYKELVSERSAVYSYDAYGNRQPCDVMAKSQLKRLASTFSGYPFPSYAGVPNAIITGFRLPVYVDEGGDLAFLKITSEATADLLFEVEYYRFLPELKDDTDSNGFLRRYFETVVAKAKSIGFADTNDPISADFDSLFEKKFAESARSDAVRALSGTRLQM